MKNIRWFDCHGVELHEGDKVRNINSGKEELVYACQSQTGPDEVNLGLNASNEKFLELHPNWPREIYPFDNFSYCSKNGERHLLDYEKVV